MAPVGSAWPGRAQDQGDGDGPDHDMQQCHDGETGAGDDVEHGAVRRRLGGVDGCFPGRVPADVSREAGFPL